MENLNIIIEKLISGQTVIIKDEATKKAVKEKLREIKNNCTVVLSQLK